jgi:hypothetical protein
MSSTETSVAKKARADVNGILALQEEALKRG